MAQAGYSGTPLAKKLGLKNGMTIITRSSPQPYNSYFSQFPNIIKVTDPPAPESIDFIHIFGHSFEQLEKHYPPLKQALKKNGLMWISWPKKSSKIESNITRESLRSYVLDRGLVDVKVCAIDDDWSALKFVYRVKDR
ncbi:MAG: DUF3052 domain-containing protein [Hyphomonadaceae bacterium]|nr:DUF3052 domain-containing protein [Hyphomonadaceae bacterium]